MWGKVITMNPREFRIVAILIINVIFLVVDFPYLRHLAETNAPDFAGQLIIAIVVVGASLWGIWIEMNAIYDERTKEKRKNDEGDESH